MFRPGGEKLAEAGRVCPPRRRPGPKNSPPPARLSACSRPTGGRGYGPCTGSRVWSDGHSLWIG